MNWGHKIILGYILFAGFVFTLVFKMITSGNDLVKEKYFKTGKQVNQEIHLLQESESIKNNVTFSVKNPDAQTIELRLQNQKEALSGEIELICLSNDQADQRVPLQLEMVDSQWVQIITLDKFQHGNWVYEIRGKAGEKDFLVKSDFKI